MKLFLAAPASGLPLLPMALPSQASCLHFFMKLVLAAPASGLPSLPMALVSQDCANAEPAANAVISAASRMRFIIFLPSLGDVEFMDWDDNPWRIFVLVRQIVNSIRSVSFGFKSPGERLFRRTQYV